MSKKRITYSIELKTRLVLEILKGEKTLNEIASANNITPKNLQNWKKSVCSQIIKNILIFFIVYFTRCTVSH